MSSTTYDTLAKNILLFAHHPAAMQTLLLNQLLDVEDAEGQIVLRDPTDPVVYLAEMGTMLGHATLMGLQESVPKTFPSMAQTYDDLFRHMSDVDYVDVFSQP